MSASCALTRQRLSVKKQAGGTGGGLVAAAATGKGLGGARRAAFPVQFFGLGRPCDRAATSFSSSSSLTCPDSVLRQSGRGVITVEIPQVQFLERSFTISGQYIEKVVDVLVVMRGHFLCTGGPTASCGRVPHFQRARC